MVIGNADSVPVMEEKGEVRIDSFVIQSSVWQPAPTPSVLFWSFGVFDWRRLKKQRTANLWEFWEICSPKNRSFCRRERAQFFLGILSFGVPYSCDSSQLSFFLSDIPIRT